MEQSGKNGNDNLRTPLRDGECSSFLPCKARFRAVSISRHRTRRVSIPGAERKRRPRPRAHPEGEVGTEARFVGTLKIIVWQG